MLTVGLTLVVLAGPPAWGAEFIQDFRQGRLNRGMLAVVGLADEPAFNPADDGLHLDLSAEPAGYRRCGLELRTRLLGDFQITAAYQRLFLFNPQRRADGPGIGIELVSARADERPRLHASLHRVATAENQAVYRVRVMSGRPQAGSRPVQLTFPARLDQGALRMVRTGDRLRFLVREGAGAEFQELTELEFSPAGILWVGLTLWSPGRPAAARTVLTDMVVRADQFTGLVDLERPPAEPRSPRWLLALTLALATLAALAGLIWHRQRSGRPWAKAQPAAVRAARPAPAPPPSRPPPPRSTADADATAAAADAGPAAEPKRPPQTAAWDELALQRLEQRARQYVAQNPHAVAFGQLYQFQFRFRNGRLHGPFVAWYELDPDRLAALGSSRQQILARLPKQFEGQYHDGRRHGTFRYWDRAGRCCLRRFYQGRPVQ